MVTTTLEKKIVASKKFNNLTYTFVISNVNKFNNLEDYVIIENDKSHKITYALTCK